MFLKTLAGLTAALMISAGATAALADTNLVIYHSWSTPSEMAALDVLKGKLKSQGIGWTEIAIPHDTGANVSLTNMVTGGNPPNVFMNSDPGIIRDLAKQGLILDLTKALTDSGAAAQFPPTVLKEVTVDGKIYKAPAGIHIDGMVYYNMDVAKKAGVDPTKWTSLADMWADEKKVEDAGYTFIAIGGNTFQSGYTFHALLAANAGPDVFNRFYGANDPAGKPDKAVLDDPGVRSTIDLFKKIAAQQDEGWVNRAWNDTTNTVIAGKALMQIHGDWMKGVWKGAGKTVGQDFNCINIPGTKAVSVTVDAFGILGGVSPEVLKAEEDFAATVVDPAINAQFAFYKGSSPVRLDVPTDKLDACNTLVLDDLKKPGMSVESPFYIADADWINSVWNTMFTAQSDKTMTTDQVIAKLKSEYDAIFN